MANNIKIIISPFDHFIHISPDTKVVNIKDKPNFKNALKVFHNDFNLQKYKVCYMPDHGGKSVADWLKDNPDATIIVSKNLDTISSTTPSITMPPYPDSNTYANIFINEITQLNDIVNQLKCDVLIKKIQKEHKNHLKVIDVRNAKVLAESAKVLVTMKEQHDENMKELRRELEAKDNILILGSLISRFRQKIIQAYNTDKNTDFIDWNDMEKHARENNNSNLISTTLPVKFGLSFDDWSKLRKHSRNINYMKHSFILKEDARECLENIRHTKYDNLVEAFEKLIELV
jgi:hypothetical protein